MNLKPAACCTARAGFRAFPPLSVGLIPWALAVGMAMSSAGFTPLQAWG